MYSNILFERKAGIAVITLNRPRVLNVLSRALKGELSDALGAWRRIRTSVPSS
jgi:enoyl-CoA hydratase/carnithine racemase